MKKIFLFFALLAGIAVMTGCQKDQEVVTLKAVIDQDVKAHFGGTAVNIPHWDSDDQVYVKGSANFSTNLFGLTNPNTTFATIEGVPASTVYSAIYPARMVGTMGTPTDGTSAGVSASIYFDPHQFYRWDENENRQLVDMPMGAVTTGNTLYFKNLCSIIRLTVTNDLTNATASHDIQQVNFDVKRLTVHASGAYVAGYANVTLSENNDPVIDVNNPNHLSSDNVLSVYKADGGSMGTIYLSSTDGPTSKTFDIVVPPFNADNLVIEVELYNHNDGRALGYYEYNVGDPDSIGRNVIVPVNLAVNTYTLFDYAYLEPGPDFNRHINSILTPNVRFIKFNHETSPLTAHNIYPDNQWETSTPTGYVELQAPNSPHKIYGYLLDPYTIEINSYGSHIYCNSDCSGMFQGFVNIQNIQWTEDVLFETEDVTDMSYMFAGCSVLQTAPNIETFNTTNVTNMAHMFEGCHFTGLDLSVFNTHNLNGDGMVAMFKNCSYLQTLDLSSFTTTQITDMTELFYNCRALRGEEGLNISQFDMSNVTTLTNMCTDLNAGGGLYNQCAIHCTNDVRTTLLLQDASGNYSTGINPGLVYFPNQGETPRQ